MGGEKEGRGGNTRGGGGRGVGGRDLGGRSEAFSSTMPTNSKNFELFSRVFRRGVEGFCGGVSGDVRGGEGGSEGEFFSKFILFLDFLIYYFSQDMFSSYVTCLLKLARDKEKVFYSHVIYRDKSYPLIATNISK